MQVQDVEFDQHVGFMSCTWQEPHGHKGNSEMERRGSLGSRESQEGSEGVAGLHRTGVVGGQSLAAQLTWASENPTRNVTAPSSVA